MANAMGETSCLPDPPIPSASHATWIALPLITQHMSQTAADKITMVGGRGMFASPTLLLSFLYFLQGLPYGLQARFLPLYFRSRGMSLTHISSLKALFFPWMCKALWAPLVDRHGNKKAWLWWSMLGLAVTCVVGAAIRPEWFVSLVVVLLVFNLLTSTQDIATDGLAIEILTSSQVASGNTAQVVGYKVGAVVGGGLLAWLSDYLPWAAVFVGLTVVYCCAILMVDRCVPDGHSYVKETVIQTGSRQRNNGSQHDDDADINASNIHRSSTHTKHTALRNEENSSKADSGSPLFSPDIDRQFVSSPSSHTDGQFSSSYEATSPTMHRTHSGSGSWCGDVSWVRSHFADVINADGTMWILGYVLVYKLGEQGSLNMVPMFLLDQGVSSAQVGFWTGVVGQVVSIAGSLAGGAIITTHRYTALGFLQLLGVVKVGIIAAQTLLISATSQPQGWNTAMSILLMLILLSVSGAISTSAFTLMMQCSQRCVSHCRASHYSLLATGEVLGKLTFSIMVGALTDTLGYTVAFGIFVALSVIVLPLFRYAPQSLSGNCLSKEGNEYNNKNC